VIKSDRDALTKLVREIGDQFSDGGIAHVFVDFCNSTRGTAYQSFWDMPETDLVATARDLAESLKTPVAPISRSLTTEDDK
jgi:hypothetical protein